MYAHEYNYTFINESKNNILLKLTDFEIRI